MLEDIVIHTNIKNNKIATSEFIEFFKMKKPDLKKSFNDKYLFTANTLMTIYYEFKGSGVIYIPMVIDGNYIELK